jgi:hypothetical protein
MTLHKILRRVLQRLSQHNLKSFIPPLYLRLRQTLFNKNRDLPNAKQEY